MLKLNALVIIFVFLTSCIIVISKDKQNSQRQLYLSANFFIILWELYPYFMPLQGAFLTRLFDWSPLVFLPLLHRETGLLTSAFAKNAYDNSFIEFEKKYFPSVMRFHDQNRVNVLIISEFLHFCYLCFFLLIYLVPLYFYLRHQLALYYATTFAILCVLFSCFITHGFIPVHGPRNIFNKMTDQRSQGYFFQLVHKVLASGSTAGTAFPSGHTGLACIVLLVTYSLDVSLFYYLFPICIGLIIATVYGRFHYFIDMVVGVFYAIVVFLLMQYFFRFDL